MKQNVTFEMARNIIKGLLAVAGIMCVIALIANDGNSRFAVYAAIIAVVCIVGTLFIVATSMKCPYCGRAIIRKCLVVKTCPHCNRNLVSGLKSKKKK